MMFEFLTEMVDADETSQINICNSSLEQWVRDTSNVALIYTDFNKWSQETVAINNVKPFIFEHVELLELIYPTSNSCSKVNDELYTLFDQYSDIMEGAQNAQLIFMNFFKHLGSIMSNVVQLDSCFEEWDGECAGRRLGRTVFALLDPAIQTTLHNLENDILL